MIFFSKEDNSQAICPSSFNPWGSRPCDLLSSYRAWPYFHFPSFRCDGQYLSRSSAIGKLLDLIRPGQVIGARAIFGNTGDAQHRRKVYLIATGSTADDNCWSIMSPVEQQLLNERETGCDGFHYTWSTPLPNGETSFTQYTFYKLIRPGWWIQKRQDTGTQRLVIGAERVWRST